MEWVNQQRSIRVQLSWSGERHAYGLVVWSMSLTSLGINQQRRPREWRIRIRFVSAKVKRSRRDDFRIESLMTNTSLNKTKMKQLPMRQKETPEKLHVSIRSASNVTARRNRILSTCLLNSTQDKLFAGIDTRFKKFTLTFWVEQDKIDQSKLVYKLFRVAFRGFNCATITTDKFYAQMLLDADTVNIYLLIRRLVGKLEDAGMTGSLTIIH